ncbi:MAG: hypothetical protein V1734_01285 [Nanoarchaeota archaeon]
MKARTIGIVAAAGLAALATGCEPSYKRPHGPERLLGGESIGMVSESRVSYHGELNGSARVIEGDLGETFRDFRASNSYEVDEICMYEGWNCVRLDKNDPSSVDLFSRAQQRFDVLINAVSWREIHQNFIKQYEEERLKEETQRFGEFEKKF